MLTINFGAANTMMKWWLKNGFDGELAKGGKASRVAATEQMTDYLAARWDGVWFKGKGIHRLLDGDQVCVYDSSRIYCEDVGLAGELEVGSKVVAVSDRLVPAGTKGVILGRRAIGPGYERFHGNAQWFLDVKWTPRGRSMNAYESDVAPAPARGAGGVKAKAKVAKQPKGAREGYVAGLADDVRELLK